MSNSGMRTSFRTRTFGHRPITTTADADGKLLTIQVIDKYTFKVIYGKTKALLPIFIPKFTMGMPGGPTFAAPEHYLKKIHPKYVKAEDLDKLAKERKAVSWEQLWNDAKGDLQGNMAFWFKNADRPTLSAWKTKISPLTDQNHIVFERNPYYFKVDPEGNQLPYIDEITHDLYENAEVFNLWLISGKIDCQWRGVDAGNFTLYKENEKKGDYRIVRWRSATTSGFMPNINCPDEGYWLSSLTRRSSARRCRSRSTARRSMIFSIVAYIRHARRLRSRARRNTTLTSRNVGPNTTSLRPTSCWMSLALPSRPTAPASAPTERPWRSRSRPPTRSARCVSMSACRSRATGRPWV